VTSIYTLGKLWIHEAGWSKWHAVAQMMQQVLVQFLLMFQDSQTKHMVPDMVNAPHAPDNAGNCWYFF
jgi:hypothetical protein